MSQLVLQVNNNGFLTFDNGWRGWSPYQFPAYAHRNIIAPFWTDIDNRRRGTISYRQYTSGSVLQQASTDINQYFPGISFSASWVFVATWDKVEYYRSYYSSSGTVNHYFAHIMVLKLHQCNHLTTFLKLFKSKTIHLYSNHYFNILLLSHYPRKHHSKWS